MKEYIFETERLAVRKFKPEDAKRLYEIHRDDDVKKWIPGEYYEDIDEALEGTEFFADCADNGRLPYVLAVVLKETGELIGDTGVNEVEGKPGEVEIGFVIGRDYRGKGYATEVLKQMSDHFTSVFHCKVLYGRVMKGNDVSVRVLEKSGYCFMDEEYGAEDDPYGNGMFVYKRETGYAPKLKEIAEKDNAAIAAIIRDNLKKHKLDIPGTVYFDEGLDRLSDLYKSADGRYYVLEDDNKQVIGGIGFARFEKMEDTAELQKLYLADAAKGSGLGYELISFIEDRMREAGFKFSYLETHDNLEAAIHIYEKAGYKEIERPKEVGHSTMNRFFKKEL